MSTLLAINGLNVGRQRKPVLTNVSFRAAAGERIAIIGPNGAGKSTLLRALAGLIPATGQIAIDATRHGDTAARARAIAYLPQDRVFYWPMQVFDIVALGRIPHGWRGGLLGAADQTAVKRALADLDLEGFEIRTVDKLSGGEQARVALARALAVEAPILLADEPVAALDARHQRAALTALAHRAQAGTLVLAVLHDLTLAARWATRVLLVSSGRIIADGPPDAVLTEQRLETVYGAPFEISQGAGGASVLVRSTFGLDPS